MANPKILIVEDVSAAHLLYKQALKGENYEILSAETGRDALRIFRNNKVDLVILDINLPDMSGLEVLAEIKQKKEDLPVIVISSSAVRNKVVDAAGYGATAYLAKPIDLKLFRIRIRNHLISEEESIERPKRIMEGLEELVAEKGLVGSLKELKGEIKGLAKKLKKVEKKTKPEEKMKKNISWEKKVVCPVCANNFLSQNYKTKSLRFIEKEADFHEHYEDSDPLIFGIWVCPSCLFAARKEDFQNLKKEETRTIAEQKIQRKTLAKNRDFNKKRDFYSGIMSYKLAIMCYESRNKTKGFLGSLYLKIAWLARVLKDKKVEKKYLKKTIENYEKALSEGERLGGQLSEIGLIYVLGELYRRTGEQEKAGKYLMSVLQSPSARSEKLILKKAQEQLELIKEAKKGEKH